MSSEQQKAATLMAFVKQLLEGAVENYIQRQDHSQLSLGTTVMAVKLPPDTPAPEALDESARLLIARTHDAYGAAMEVVLKEGGPQGELAAKLVKQALSTPLPWQQAGGPEGLVEVADALLVMREELGERLEAIVFTTTGIKTLHQKVSQGRCIGKIEETVVAPPPPATRMKMH